MQPLCEVCYLQLDFQNLARKLVIIAKIKKHKMSFTFNLDDI